MRIPTVIGVAALAVATVAATAAASGGGSVRLPLPQAAMRSHQTHPRPSGSSTGSTGSTPPAGADPSSYAAASTANQPVYTSSPPAVLTGCNVSVSNPAPLRGQTAENATVATTAGAEVRLEAHYVKTRSVHSAIADASGNAYFALTISHAQPGVTVHVTATVSLRGAKYSCSTSFTPVDPAGILSASGGGQ